MYEKKQGRRAERRRRGVEAEEMALQGEQDFRAQEYERMARERGLQEDCEPNDGDSASFDEQSGRHAGAAAD